ncbi:MAG: 5-oxoprolinase subunit PxpA [Tissierellia bacterium]|jgi:UPF0271 protein|nr:5-oxoprolinase subunit PxpA [Tissierellia bacterium]
MKIVDLNSDIGESFGSYTLGLDKEVIKFVSSVNIACGWHAGDALIMDDTVKNAVDQGVAIGAHPGYPDLVGFGRRNMDISLKEARAYILYQYGALQAFAQAHKTFVQHIKLHGAFYNTASVDEKFAKAILDMMLELDENLILMALSGSLIAKMAKEMGVKVAQEVFADRAYNKDGTLVSRKIEGSVIHDADEAIARTKRMILEGKVTTIDGEDIDIVADSICVHGDNPEAVEFVKNIRKSLIDEGIEIKPLHEFI